MGFLTLTKAQKWAMPVHQVLDEKINALLRAYSPENPPYVSPGQDLYLEIAAKALGMTLSDAKKKLSAGNPGVRSARANVKKKLFSIMYGGGVALMTLLFAVRGGDFTVSNRCRAHEQRCEMNCNEDYRGGSLARMRCYDRCRAKELICNREGDDEP